MASIPSPGQSAVSLKARFLQQPRHRLKTHLLPWHRKAGEPGADGLIRTGLALARCPCLETAPGIVAQQGTAPGPVPLTPGQGRGWKGLFLLWEDWCEGKGLPKARPRAEILRGISGSYCAHPPRNWCSNKSNSPSGFHIDHILRILLEKENERGQLNDFMSEMGQSSQLWLLSAST